MVIVILGALTATALPRFASLQRDARIAKLQGLKSALFTTANQLRALCMLQYSHCSGDLAHNTAVPGQTEPVHVRAWGQKFQIHYGWPAPFEGFGSSDGFDSIVAAMTLDGYDVPPYVGSDFEREFRIADAPDPDNCKVTYRTWFWAPDKEPTFVISSSGC